jgi:hypothetical protein
MNRTIRTSGTSVAVLLAAIGMLTSAVYAQTPLDNGVPLTGLSGGAGSETFYRIDVPAGQDELEIVMSGGLGDADLYVRLGALPTTSAYDYRPYEPGNEETVTVAKPTAGTWYIMLRGYSPYSGVTLKATYSVAVTITPLTNGVAVTDLTGSAGSELYFSIVVPAGQTKLEISMSGGTGDADLYVRKDSLPTTTSYDYRPYLSGNNETVTVNDPAATTWYIMIRGYSPYTGVALLAGYSGGIGTVLENGVPVSGLSGTPSSVKIFRIDVPAGQINLEVLLSDGTGDADLFVRLGAVPTTTSYDYRSILAGNDETITVNNPAAGSWYIMIRAYSSYTGVTLKATYGDVLTLEDEVPISDISGALGSEQFYKIEVPSGQTSLAFSISGGAGNADMYIRRGAKPTTATWDYRPYLPGNAESVNISDPQGGTWYVMLAGTQAYTGVTLLADYSFSGSSTVLSNGVPVPNISGAALSERFYRIEVPGGQSKLEIKISGGTGDADLYVKRGAPPTTSDYDYRPYLSGNNETVTVSDPAGGTWHIMIRGYQPYTGVTLVATYSTVAPPPGEVVALSNGVPVPGIAGTTGSEKFYKIDVPTGQVSLEIVISGGTGDADLYVRKGLKPTASEWDYRPYLMGNDETVTINNPQAATYYIMLRAFSAYAGVTLKATYVPAAEPVTPLANAVPVLGLAGATDSEKHFKIDVPAGQTPLAIEISGGSGDVDLYVKKGTKPTISTWDYRPYLVGNNEKVEIINPSAGTWYIMLYGRSVYAGVTLVATYGTPTGNNFASDPDCVALWKFDNLATLTTDSIGTNTLENHGVTVETADRREGAGCASFRVSEADWMIIDDADLSANFPTRLGDPSPDMSICFWMKPRTFPFGGTMICKYLVATDDRSWRLLLGGALTGNLKVALGIGSGNNFKEYNFNAPEQQLVKDHWYHVAFTYKDADRSYHVRVWDGTTAVLVYDATGFATSHMAITDAPLVLGSAPLLSEYYDGLLDEVVVFSDILTTAEIDQIRQGIYVKAP